MAQASARKVEQTGAVEMERVCSALQSEQLARTPEPLLPKRKGTEPSVQIVRWQSQGEREPHLGEKEEG